MRKFLDGLEVKGLALFPDLGTLAWPKNNVHYEIKHQKITKDML